VTEQTRIVHKVNELMMLCDKLETQQLERARLVPLLSQASHNCFAAAPTATNLDRIFDQVGNISPEDIHKTILTFAVRGLLVPQNSQDEPSTVSLERVSVDIRKWAVEHLDERYPVPNSWGWLQFGGVGEQRLGKMLDAQKNKGQLKPYLRNTNVQWLVFDLNDVKEMRIEKEEEAELRLRYGDLLVCEGGEPGRCAIWKDEVQEMYFQKALHRVRPCEALLPEYLALNLQIDCKNGVLASYFTGATIKHLTGRSLSLYSIPVPPLDEQRRIIAKVDQLMALVNTLDAHRRERDRLGEIFAQAVVTSLTHIQIQEAKGNMRAPKTQLVSNLKLGTKPKAKDNAPLAALLVEAKGEMSAKTLWQQSNLSIDDFYQQLRAELAHGWIAPPKPAEMKELIKPEPDQPILMRVTRRKAIRQLTD
jgi:type I restriction enzyme S subunit